MSVLSNYKVRFSIKNIFNQNFKSMNTVNDMLTVYITDHNTIQKVNQLLDDINAVLNNNYPLGGGQTQIMYLSRISAAETKIYQDMEDWEQDNSIQPDFTLPTTDLKVIVEAWRDYLQQ